MWMMMMVATGCHSRRRRLLLLQLWRRSLEHYSNFFDFSDHDNFSRCQVELLNEEKMSLNNRQMLLTENERQAENERKMMIESIDVSNEKIMQFYFCRRCSLNLFLLNSELLMSHAKKLKL
jgi:hypothetical protein